MATAETSQAFYATFRASAATAEAAINALGSGADGTRVEHVQAGLAALSRAVQEAAAYVPAHDRRTYAQGIAGLQARLERARAAVAPRRRFAFGGGAGRRAEGGRALGLGGRGAAGGAAAGDAGSVAGAGRGEGVHGFVGEKAETMERRVVDHGGMLRRPSFSADVSIRLSDQRSAHIVLPDSAARATTTGSLSNLSRCVVDMCSAATASSPFASLTLRDISDSLVICGNVSGATHVTGLVGCVIVVACRQFRMHESRDCDVYLHATGRPIVEAVERVRFAPFPASFASILDKDSANAWDQVDDFKWLKAEPSPNWSILPGPARISGEVWRDGVCNSVAGGLASTLGLVGIRGEDT